MNQFTPQGVTAKNLVQQGLLATLRVASDFHYFRWCRSSLAQPPANGCEAFGFKKSVKLFPFQCTSCFPAFADEVSRNNGDHLTGRMDAVEGNACYFETSYDAGQDREAADIRPFQVWI